MRRAKVSSFVVLVGGILAAAAIATLGGCQTGNTGSPGNTPNIAPQSSYRIVGEIGTPFQALVSDSRSSWTFSGSIPTSIVIVNDSPPDRILATKLTNGSQLLSLQVIQGISVGTLDTTVSAFGTVVGNIGGTLASFAQPALPDVRYFVNTPLTGVFDALIESENMSSALESRVPAVILFDKPNGGGSGRVDGVFAQPTFTGVLQVDLVVNGQLVQTASGGNPVTVNFGG